MVESLIGGNILLNHLRNKQYVISRLKILNPVLCVATVDNSTDMKQIVDLRAELPNTLVIGRVYHPQDGAYHMKPDDSRYWIASPIDFLNAWGDLGKNGGVLYALNEPGTDIDDVTMTRLVSWTCETIKLANVRGIRLCVLNLATGHPKLINGEWDNRFDPVLKMLSEHRQHMLGCHEYDIGDNDRTGRIEAMFKRCITLGIQPPLVALTETGYDKSDGEPDNLNGYKSRGLTGEQLGQRRAEVWRRFYLKHPEIIGEAVFCAGDTWSAFDFQEDNGFWGYLIANPVVRPIPTPLPIPPAVSSPTSKPDTKPIPPIVIPPPVSAPPTVDVPIVPPSEMDKQPGGFGVYTSDVLRGEVAMLDLIITKLDGIKQQIVDLNTAAHDLDNRIKAYRDRLVTLADSLDAAA
jgi:hypothetical protein